MRHTPGFFIPILLVALGAACGGAASTSGSAEMESSGMEQRAVVGCGDRIEPLIAASGPLTASGSFPSEVVRADGIFAGRITVTGAGRRVAGVASPEADVFVTRSGEVVATPLVKDAVGAFVDLAPGASQTFSARGSVRQCTGNDALPAGRYEVYAVVVVDESKTGTAVVAAGGPWPVEIV